MTAIANTDYVADIIRQHEAESREDVRRWAAQLATLTAERDKLKAELDKFKAAAADDNGFLYLYDLTWDLTHSVEADLEEGKSFDQGHKLPEEVEVSVTGAPTLKVGGERSCIPWEAEYRPARIVWERV